MAGHSRGQRVTRAMASCICAVYGCANSSYTTDLTFFRLPSMPGKFARWLKLMHREDLNNKMYSNHFICEAHFDPNAIVLSASKKLLRRNAEPTLLLPTPSTDIVVRVSKSSQYDPADLLLYFRKNRVDRNDPKEEKKQDFQQNKSQKETFDSLCDEFLSKEIAVFVKSQASLRFQFCKNKFNTDFKNFCLKIYHSNPHAYSFMGDTLNLPNRRDLVRQYTPFITEDLESLTKVLKTKVESMTEKAKKCSIIVRTVRLKPRLFYHIAEDRIIGLENINGGRSFKPAEYAVVVMVCGIYDNWKLAAGYALLSKRTDLSISSYVCSLLTKLMEINLNVQICIINPQLKFIFDEKRTHISKNKPFFSLNSKKILFSHDPMSLIVLLKNIFTRYDFHFKGYIAKWQDIVDFFEKDNKKHYKLAPQLTQEHITGECTHEKRFVSELFSENVASGISMYVDFNQISESAKGTIQFVTLMGKLIKCFTSKHSNEIYVTYLHEGLTFFQNLSIFEDGVNCTSNSILQLISDIQIAIKAFILLFEECNLDGNYPMVLSHLSMNPLNKSFASSLPRKRVAHSSPWMFIKLFRKVFFYQIMKPVKGKYSENVANLLGSFYKRVMPKSQAYQEKSKIHKSTVKISDYRDIELPDKHQLLYLHNYLQNKVTEKHKICDETKQKEDATKSAGDDVEDDEMSGEGTSENSLILLLKNAEADLQRFFKSDFNSRQVLSTLRRLNIETHVYVPMPCACFPTPYLRDLYFRVRISQILKINNQNFRMALSKETNFQFISLT